MHIVLIRHGSRIDKPKNGSKTHLVDTDSWLSNFDPPLDAEQANLEMERSFKKLQSDLTQPRPPKSIVIHSSPYNRCIQTSELLLDRITKCKNFQLEAKENTRQVQRPNIKLRVDQALSEWLNENYNLNYLPPNDDGYSMINNISAYLNQPEHSPMDNEYLNSQTRSQLKDKKDQTWSYNQLGHCGDYGESPEKFTKRCFNYLIYLLQYYYIKQDPEKDKDMVVFIVSHGAVISTILQILLGRPIFNEVPLLTPIYFKQSERKRSIFKMMDYDFNLNNLLNIKDEEFYRLLDKPIDMTRLDPDNLTSELTIGTTGYTTIIQSIPKTKTKKKRRRRRRRSNSQSRPRRNTFDLAENQPNEEQTSLKQTRSSKQLYLLNGAGDKKEQKLIDLHKLHSYFYVDSEGSEESASSDDDDDGSLASETEHVGGRSDSKGAKNIFRGRISSLSSFNEENKNKFLLDKSDFLAKEAEVRNPYSHFFPHQVQPEGPSTLAFDDSRKLFSRYGTNESLKDLVPKEWQADSYNPQGITDSESSDSDYDYRSDSDQENGVLLFGQRPKPQMAQTTDEDLVTPILQGTFTQRALGSASNVASSGGETPSGSRQRLHDFLHRPALARSHSDTPSSDDSDSSSAAGGWFGGFSR